VDPFVPPSLDEVFALNDGADFELYLQLLEESEERGDALVIRYEVATRDYVELRHPAAHFHIGLHEGGWPVATIGFNAAVAPVRARLSVYSKGQHSRLEVV
jgi:hypothetical protein